MPEIQKIDDAYIDAVIKASKVYDPNLDVTQGVRLRELIKLMRDQIEQQVENGATIFQMEEYVRTAPLLPDQISRTNNFKTSNEAYDLQPGNIYKTTDGGIKYVVVFGNYIFKNSLPVPVKVIENTIQGNQLFYEIAPGTQKIYNYLDIAGYLAFYVPGSQTPIGVDSFKDGNLINHYDLNSGGQANYGTNPLDENRYVDTIFELVESAYNVPVFYNLRIRNNAENASTGNHVNVNCLDAQGNFVLNFNVLDRSGEIVKSFDEIGEYITLQYINQDAENPVYLTIDVNGVETSATLLPSNPSEFMVQVTRQQAYDAGTDTIITITSHY